MSVPATPAQREAFETAVAMTRALLIEGTPPAHVAAYWGLSEQRLAAKAIQDLGELMVGVAKATGAWADLGAIADGLHMTDDD